MHGSSHGMGIPIHLGSEFYGLAPTPRLQSTRSTRRSCLGFDFDDEKDVDPQDLSCSRTESCHSRGLRVARLKQGNCRARYSVKSNGSNFVNVLPGGTVNFTVEGVLSGDLNEGLALVGFDLHFTGGALPSNAVVTLSANPMKAFVKPDSITNPAGFGGTLIGGGQNTIKNSVDNPACVPNCATFPIGTPILRVAQPSVTGSIVIATGSFTAPVSGGPFQLQVLNGFANVIKVGEVLS